MRFVNAALQTPLRRALAAGLCAFVLAAILAHGRNSPYNGYVLLAQAFLHGRIAIDWPGAWIDALPYAGRYWVIEAPLPAVLLLPWVAIAAGLSNWPATWARSAPAETGINANIADAIAIVT